MSDARERLRRYLEQRRELGESEFVLDSLSVEDALRVLMSGATPPAAPPAAPTGANRSQQRTDASPPPADSPRRRAAADAAGTGDWREALRALDPSAGAKSSASTKPGEPTKPSASPTPKPPAFPPAPAVPTPAGAEPVATAELVAPITIGADSAGSALTHLGTIEAIADAIRACQACELYATAINAVPGEGDPLAKFVVVGEAPGATEDELGRPFVGKSGELLNKILEAIGFTRDKVFILNVLKHRPPANRNPSASEILACRPYLLRQLEILRPRVILALGTFAAQTLLESDVPIGRLRGTEHRYHGIPLIATYHPAALLRNPNWKRPAWEDVQLARRIFDRA